MFLQRDGRYAWMTVDKFGARFRDESVLLALTSCRGGKVRFVDPANREFRQVNSQLFGEFTHSCKARMQHFSDGVVEASDADVIWDANARFL